MNQDITAQPTGASAPGDGLQMAAATARSIPGPSRPAKKPKSAGPLPSRTLRARPSDPLPPGQNAPINTINLGPLRKPTEKELDNVHRRIGPEGVSQRREELLQGKELELKQLVDQHDTAVREKFHLERYVTILTGWDPDLAKVDNSPVFLDYKRFHHNLLDLAPAPLASSADAGPSRPRTSMPFRTTRRAAHEQAELFTPATPSTSDRIFTNRSISGLSKGKGKAKMEPVPEPPVSGKGKGKARLSDLPVERPTTDTDTPIKIRLSIKGSHKPLSKEMLPPPVPERHQGKGSRRATMGGDIEPLSDDIAEVEVEPGGKGKKRGRLSLPAMSKSKKLRPLEYTEEAEGSESPVAETPVETPASPEPPPAPRLPSLAHVSFPPPPYRPVEKIRGPRQVWYTGPGQRLLYEPKYGGEIAPFLESYIHIDDSAPSPTIESLQLRAAREAYFRNRVRYLQQQGRLLRLLEEADDVDSAIVQTKSQHKAPGLPSREVDHQDSLLAHMIQVRNAIMNEAKSKPLVCRRIARMIQTYWERIEGRGERERQAEERELKRKARELVKALRRRWGLAVKVIRAQIVEAQKAEQDRLGKEHLQSILQRSTGILEAQRDDIAGVDGSGELEDGEEDEDMSDGTEDVSAAQDSEEQPLGTDVEAEVQRGDDEAEGDANLEVPEDAIANMDLDSPGSGMEGMEGMEGMTPTSELAESEEDEDGSQAADEYDDDSDTSKEEEDPERVDLRALVSDGIADNSPDGLTADAASTMEAVAVAEGIVDPQLSPTMGGDGLIAAPSDGVTDGIHEEFADIATHPVGSMPEHHSPVRFGSTLVVEDSQATAAADPENLLPSSPSLAPRVRRARKSRSISLATNEDDPDANDTEFTDALNSEIDDRDHNLDMKMEDDEDSDEQNSEDAGLLADANLPIEELMKQYGYGLPTQETGDVEVIINGHESIQDETGRIETDKYLLDDALTALPASPALVLDGKRQRRVRSVWTPEDYPPPPALVKRPKVEEGDEEIQMTPELSDDDEEDDDGAESAIAEGDDGGKVRPPFLLRGTLRPYQQAGLEWLASLYANKMNGILADEMGLGKTIQTIALLGHLACDKHVWGQHLIIVPTSVILNWEMEFKKFLPGLKVLTYYGNQKERKDKRVGWHTDHAWQVCITSYQIVLADQHIFRRKAWVYMILDEAHNIKNFRSQRWQTLLGFKAQRRLLLTGTPLQNNLMELWSLLYFLMPGGVAADATAVVGFANHKEFTEWFSNPMDKAVESGDQLDQETLETVSKLHTLLRPFILRRLKSEVETQLPGKFEHVVYCRLSKRQRFLYDEFMSRSSTKEALTSGGYLGVVNTLMQLRKVCNHPDLFEVRPVRTSFAMDRSVLADYEPSEILVRKRLLAKQDELDLEALNLRITSKEHESGWALAARSHHDASNLLPHAYEKAKKGRQPVPPPADTRTVEGWLKYRAYIEEQASISRWRSLRDINRIRCQARPIYGHTLLEKLSDLPQRLLPDTVSPRRRDMLNELTPPASRFIMSLPDRARTIAPVVEQFAVIPPNAVALDVPSYALPQLKPSSHPALLDPEFDTLHHASVKLQIAFPDASLLQYDCGKLQKLYEMLRSLKADGHRVLIFTQMTRVLDILEMFLSYNGHRYLRLDGSTKIEDRQIITERFNSDSRVFCFIASSRSGGVGINLTGADTVFFYDSDWNPSMDRQCMDRAHRIGQTREVHIYRFVSSHTVEENMLKKANQKRLLDRFVIQEGDFTTDFFGKMDWRDLIDEPKQETGGDRIEDVQVEAEPEAVDAETEAPRVGEERELAKALAEVEDEEDAAAAMVAQGEGEMDLAEFNEAAAARKARFEVEVESGTPITPGIPSAVNQEEVAVVGEGEEEEEEEEDEVGGVDEYMLKWVEEDWDWFSTL